MNIAPESHAYNIPMRLMNLAMTKKFNSPIPSDVELIRCYGGSVSHAALDPLLSTFRTPGIDGLIGFLVVRRCAVVQGDPICAPEYKTSLADAFSRYCANKGWSILYSAATEPMHAYARKHGYATMQFAELLIANPQHDPELERRGRHLRQHLNHVRRTGLVVREYLGNTKPNAQLETQIQATYEQWLTARHGLQMHLGQQHLFANKSGRRWFVADQSGNVVGMLSMLHIECFESHHLINIVFSSPSAPLYSNELMVVTALQALREEGVHSVCLGVGPLAALGQIEGCHGMTEFLARKLYQLAATAMNLHGRTVFWEKYHITQREPLYLLFQSPRIGLRELNALFKALHCSVT
ncbi:MAG: DUF2156 domain-containing protein [Methylococcaceae bacterium]|nr:DUF2156 domain-containing protein [Methylococcaceae bacterium]